MQHCNALQESGRILPATARGMALGQVQTPQVMQHCNGDKWRFWTFTTICNLIKDCNYKETRALWRTLTLFLYFALFHFYVLLLMRLLHSQTT